MPHEYKIRHYPRIVDRHGAIVANPDKQWIVQVRKIEAVAEVRAFWTESEAQRYVTEHEPAEDARLIGPEDFAANEFAFRRRRGLAT